MLKFLKSLFLSPVTSDPLPQKWFDYAEGRNTVYHAIEYLRERNRLEGLNEKNYGILMQAYLDISDAMSALYKPRC